MKNIPYPTERKYIYHLTEKIIDLIRRLRWKSYFFLNPSEGYAQKEVYGLKTQKTPPKCKHLDHFETDLLNMIRKVKFRKELNPFQQELKKDSSNIKTSTKIWMKADKTQNFYKVNPEEYHKYLVDTCCKDYRLDHSDTGSEIDCNTAKIADKLKVRDRMGKIDPKNAYVLIKDHKPNFENNRQFRLINPTKNELGLVSKKIVKEIVETTLNKTNYHLWKNSMDTIDWFQKIENKSKATLIQFDIIDYYPSITKELLGKSIDFAKKYAYISQEDIDIIMACRKTILRNNKSDWVKKGNNNFDLPMGAYDSAQLSDLVGIYIIHSLGNIVPPSQIGLYRDDGLILVPNSNGPLTSRTSKKIVNTFQKLGLRIEIKPNCKIVNFLDITLNLETNTFLPFHKEGHIPLYVNRNSNHPKSILDKIPHSINIRINRLSANNSIFKNNKSFYDEALKESGYTKNLQYIGKPELNRINGPDNSRNRKRKVIWFNPPYCKISKLGIGRTFLNLINKHFNQNNPLTKILNRNTLKISYSCTPNMSSIINAHNKKILNEYHRKLDAEENTNTNPNSSRTRDSNLNTGKCNCRDTQQCPLDRNCLASNIIYEAQVSARNDPGNIMHYLGITAGPFKQRYYTHRHSFNNPALSNQTELSKHYWSIKNSNNDPVVKWKIVRTSNSATNFKGKCPLCISEKIEIILFKDSRKLLNKRNELIAKCRHKGKFQI